MFYNLLLSTAWAQATETAAAPKPSLLESAFPFVLMIGVLFLLIIRPQQKRASTQKQFLTTLKRGDSVLTTGGILGTIEGLTESFVTLEIANNVRIRVLKGQIASGFSEEMVKK